MGTNDNDECCGICLGGWTNPVKLPCGHSFCAECLGGWKSKFCMFGRQESQPKEQQGRRCPLCRGTIPPSQEQLANIKMAKSLMKDTSDPKYEHRARMVKQFEAEYGEDWDDTLMVGYDNDFVSLPVYVVRAAKGGTGRNLRILLQWLGEANIKGKINAKCESVGNMGLLYIAAYTEQRDLMSYLLLNGADVNILNSSGGSVIAEICYDGNICHVTNDVSTTIKMLLSWGADLFLDGRHVTSPKGVQRSHTNISREGDVTIAKLVSSELDGRRCEIVSAPNARDDLVGKTCLVEEYIKASDQYKVTMEFTNESLLLRADNLKRRDRTPQDPGYYVECKNNRLIRHDFKSNEECQAFIASLDVEDEKMAAVDPDSEAKADQAAADLLAELGLDDLEGPSSSAPKKGKPQSVPAGKKKKRGSGKKKGRK